MSFEIDYRADRNGVEKC